MGRVKRWKMDLRRRGLKGSVQARLSFEKKKMKRKPKRKSKPKQTPKDSGQAPSYKHVVKNRYVTQRPSGKRMPPCDCSEKEPCRSENCLNGLTYVECDPASCPAGKQCGNKRLQQRLWAKVEPFKTTSCGWGLRALQSLESGNLVIEYVGEVIDDKECQKRLDLHVKKGAKDFYFFSINRKLIIDGRDFGNSSRFINHSCQPNCEAQVWEVLGERRVGIYAIGDIESGTELTINYQDVANVPCKCGAKGCKGHI